MRFEELPVQYLTSAEDVLEVRYLPAVPEWTHNPYTPIIRGDKIEVARANHQKKLSHYWNRYQTIHVVETEAWWLDNDHTYVAIRCRWECAAGNVWWKKRSQAIWFFEKVEGCWEKRRLNGRGKGRKRRDELKALMAFEELVF